MDDDEIFIPHLPADGAGGPVGYHLQQVMENPLVTNSWLVQTMRRVLGEDQFELHIGVRNRAPGNIIIRPREGYVIVEGYVDLPGEGRQEYLCTFSIPSVYDEGLLQVELTDDDVVIMTVPMRKDILLHQRNRVNPICERRNHGL